MNKLLASALLAISLTLPSCRSPSLESRINGTSIEFLKDMPVKIIQKDNLVNYLASKSGENESIKVYFRDRGLLFDITEEGGIEYAYANEEILDRLLKTNERFTIIHNHNDKKLNLDMIKEGIPLYWIAPSDNDLLQLIDFGHGRGYAISSKFGLLEVSTSKDTFKLKDSSYLMRNIKSESLLMQKMLEGVNDLKGIKSWADHYRGMFKLKFFEKK